MADLKFEYKYKEGFTLQYANGAVGGHTTKGDVFINFFVEHPQMVSLQIQAVEGNTLSQPKAFEPQDMNTHFIRTVHSGVILNLAEAKSIHQWLGEQITNLEKIHANEQTQ